MADFVQSSQTKSAVRKLVNPVANIAAFNAIVDSVISGNPFGCVAYMTAGTNHPPVEKTKESYTARIIYQDADAKTIGHDTSQYNTITGFNAGISVILGDANLAAAHSGTPVHDESADTYSATLRCHDPNGELYMVTFGRSQVSLTSYSDEGIRTKVETWADSVAALA